MALSERQQAEKELHEHQEKANLVNSPAELHTEAPGVDGEFVTVHAVGGFVWVGVTGNKEVKFDRDAAAVLQQKLAAAFQNVA